jgi:hypothetical protein
MGSRARHSNGRKASSRQSSERNRPQTRQQPQSAPRKRKKSAPAVPLTPLLRIEDALYIIGATADVTASALKRAADPDMERAANVLNEHVFYPLETLRKEISRHAASSKTPIHNEPLAKKERRRATTPYRKWKKS